MKKLVFFLFTCLLSLGAFSQGVTVINNTPFDLQVLTHDSWFPSCLAAGTGGTTGGSNVTIASGGTLFIAAATGQTVSGAHLELHWVCPNNNPGLFTVDIATPGPCNCPGTYLDPAVAPIPGPNCWDYSSGITYWATYACTGNGAVITVQ